MGLRQAAQLSLAYIATETTKSGTITFPPVTGSRYGGRGVYGILVTPDLAGAAKTFTLNITDAASKLMYTKTTLAENTTYYLRREDTSNWGGNTRTFDIPLFGVITIQGVWSAGLDALDTGTVTIDIWWED